MSDGGAPAPVRVVPAHALPALATARALIVAYVRELGVDLSFQGFDAELAALPGEYAPPRGALFVALESNELGTNASAIDDRSDRLACDAGGDPAVYAAGAAGAAGTRVGLGVVGLRPFGDPGTGDAELKRMYVAPAGRRQGVGRLLAEAAIAAARTAGYRRVLLDTLSTMTAANALYRSLGFVAIAPYRPNPLPDAAFFALSLAAPNRSRRE